MKTLRFVHLSDIHFGQEIKGGLHVHEDVRVELERDCERQKEKIGAADAIIVTGDIAYSGKSNEYVTAMSWLDSLCKKVGCDEDSVLVVPGNHDVDLEMLKGTTLITQNTLRACKADEIEKLLHEIHKTPDEAHPFGPKSAAYRTMASAYDCDYKLPEPYWIKHFDLSFGCKLRFIGLNTAQVSALKDREGDLLLGQSQYVFNRENNVESIVLMHHPPHWLKDKVAFEDYFNSRVRVLICGHEHKAKFTTAIHGQKYEQLIIDSGATNPPQTEAKYGYTYNWLEFSFSEPANKTSHLKVRIYPRSWNQSDTKFDADSKRITLDASESAEISLACPDITVSGVDDSSRTASPAPIDAEDSQIKLTRPSAQSIGKTVTSTIQQRKVLVSSGEDRRFKRLQYLFWRYTKGINRLSILVELELIQNKNNLESLPQDFEMMLLQRAKDQKKLKILWEKVMALVPPEQQQSNPFEEGE